MNARAKFPPYAFATLLLTCGCQALAPSEPLPEPARSTHALRQEPLRAAGCVAGNVDRYRSPYSARIAAGSPPAVAEVIVSGRQVVATVQLFAAGAASTAVIVSQPFHERDELVAAMVEAC